jgi:parallel beta-helix repeat protein
LANIRFSLVEVEAPDGYPVHNLNTGLNYTTIQGAIDAPETLDGHTIFVESGIYYEHVDVIKNLTLIGENNSNTIIDGSGAENVVEALLVNVSFFTIRNGLNGVLANGHCIIEENRIAEVTKGIVLNGRENLVVENDLKGNIYLGLSAEGNTVQKNNVTGVISLSNAGNHNTIIENHIIGSISIVSSITSPSKGHIISHNYIVRGHNGNGIYLFNSEDDLIFANEIVDCNYDAICVDSFCNNLTIIDNNIRDCSRAIYLTGEIVPHSRRHAIYHNNFINNKFGVLLNGASDVQWDNGYPSGGNYWSDYDGTDVKKGPYQNETGRDNIGDTPYVCPEGFQGGFQDRYPLVNPYPYVFTLEITKIDFEANDTSIFYVTIQNSDLSLTSVNVTRVDIIMENETIREVSLRENSPILPFTLFPNTSISLVCVWNWSVYQCRDVIVAVHSHEDYVAYKRQTTALITPGLIKVPRDYDSISDAIEAANPGDVIFISNGVYHENLRIDKCLTLAGEDTYATIIDGGGEIKTIVYVTANNVNITGLTIRNTRYRCIDVSAPGLYNTVAGMIISRNIINPNNDWAYGVILHGDNNFVLENQIVRSGYGLYLEGDSNTISGNNITANVEYAIRLCWSSCYNTISRNNICNNTIGIEFENSSNNSLYHNNFINNAQQVSADGSRNVWDDGNEGNYWSNYTGVDLKSGFCQNETGNDGIGDMPHTIDANNIDNYPLMGMFSDFNATSEYHVQIICNSTVSNFQFNGTAISFNVTGVDGTTGFCRICIPTALMNATYKVFVNGTEVSYNLLPFSNETDSYLYFNYTHSTQEVIIIPEFPSFLILPLFMIATLLAVIVYKRKHVV